jgi:hypothetical protein
MNKKNGNLTHIYQVTNIILAKRQISLLSFSYIKPFVRLYCRRQTMKFLIHIVTATHIPIILIRSIIRSA